MDRTVYFGNNSKNNNSRDNNSRDNNIKNNNSRDNNSRDNNSTKSDIYKTTTATRGSYHEGSVYASHPAASGSNQSTA